jgi:hypothetical protein
MCWKKARLLEGEGRELLNNDHIKKFIKVQRVFMDEKY